MAPPRETTSVLIVGNRNYSSLATVRALRTGGYEPWLALYQSGTYASCSRMISGTISVPDPDSDGDGFVRELAAAAAQLSVAAVLPMEDNHLLRLAGRESDFAGIALGITSRESVERATAKKQLPELAANAGLRVPPTTLVCGRSEAVGAFGFPSVVKPLRSWMRNPDGTLSACSVRYVSTKQAAEKALDDLPGKEGLVQRYISGPLLSVAGISWEGELICALHQVSVRTWPVHVGGSAYAETIPPDAGLESGVVRLLQTLDWSGPFQAQFIRISRDEHYLIDLNPRMYGSLALAVAAGLNLPCIWVDLLLGRRPDIGDYRRGVRYRNEEKEMRVLARMLMKGGGRLRALRGLVPRRHTTHAIFSLHDPKPLLISSGAKLVRWLKHGLKIV